VRSSRSPHLLHLFPFVVLPVRRLTKCTRPPLRTSSVSMRSPPRFYAPPRDHRALDKVCCLPWQKDTKNNQNIFFLLWWILSFFLPHLAGSLIKPAFSKFCVENGEKMGRSTTPPSPLIRNRGRRCGLISVSSLSPSFPYLSSVRKASSSTLFFLVHVERRSLSPSPSPLPLRQTRLRRDLSSSCLAEKTSSPPPPIQMASQALLLPPPPIARTNV